MTSSILSVAGLRVQAGDKLLCDGLDLEVGPGQFWCIIGKNGAGKSTLLHTLAGLAEPAQGRILLEDTDIRSLRPLELARRRGLLAQQQFDAFSSTALETVIAGRHPFQTGLGWDSDEDRNAAIAALSAVGLGDCAHKDVMRLSGGERQRVALAALLVQDPDVLLLDEPTAHQDAAAQLAVMALMRDLLAAAMMPGAQRGGKAGKAGKAVIAACHDLNLVSRFASHVLALAHGRHWAGRAEEVLTPAILQQAFGCRFDAVETGSGRVFVPLM